MYCWYILPCKNFKKLEQLNIYKLHCSEKYVTDSEDCSAQNHTLKVTLFERTEYLNKGKTKKKLQLIGNVSTPAKFFDLFKTTLMCFSCYRLSVNPLSAGPTKWPNICEIGT